jgi:hypothetical protein
MRSLLAARGRRTRLLHGLRPDQVAIHAAWLPPTVLGGDADLRLECVTGRPRRIVGVTCPSAQAVALETNNGPLATLHGRLATCLATSGRIRLLGLRRPLAHGERVALVLHFADGDTVRVDATTRDDWLRAPRPRMPRAVLQAMPERRA